MYCSCFRGDCACFHPLLPCVFFGFLVFWCFGCVCEKAFFITLVSVWGELASLIVRMDVLSCIVECVCVCFWGGGVGGFVCECDVSV